MRRSAGRAPGTKSTLLKNSDEKALAACVAYYRDLLLLENYAIINYCGFSKILKKHDKRTGYETRARFMRICVSPQPFTHYPRLLELIKEAEDLYRELLMAASRSATLENSSRALRDQETLVQHCVRATQDNAQSTNVTADSCRKASWTVKLTSRKSHARSNGCCGMSSPCKTDPGCLQLGV